MFPCELPAYKTVRPSSGFRIGTVFISAPRPGRTAPDGELSAIRPKGGSGFRKFPAKKEPPAGGPRRLFFVERVDHHSRPQFGFEPRGLRRHDVARVGNVDQLANSCGTNAA